MWWQVQACLYCQPASANHCNACPPACSYGMEDNKSKGKAETKYDIGGPNHIRLE